MKARIALATAAAALALTAPAQADDASVFAAYNDTAAAERDAADKEYIDAFKEAQRDGATDAEVRRIIAANATINALVKQVQAAVAAQEPSTELGLKARTLSLRNMALLLRINKLETKGDEAWLAHQARKAHRYYKKSDRLYRQYLRLRKQTTKAYKRAGFKVTR